MRRIPIYDASAPITCTLGADEVPDRRALLERLRDEARSVERIDDGLLLTFPDRPDVVADVERFARDEQRCCGFWGFAVERPDDAVVLHWEGPPAVADLLDQLHDVFTGTRSLDAVTGLF